MWNKERSVTLSIAVCILFTAILTAALFCMPWLVKTWFSLYRGWDENSPAMDSMLTLFSVCFYPCAVFAYMTLYSLLRLLFNIRRQDIFVPQNPKYLRRICWCCFAVAGITFAGGWFYIPFFFVAVAAAFVGLLLRVVKNVMQNAVQINAENELTI